MLLLLSLLILPVLALLPLSIKVHYRREDNDDQMDAAISMFGGPLPIRFNVPVARMRGSHVEVEAEAGAPHRPLLEKRLAARMPSLPQMLAQLKQLLEPITALINFFFHHSHWRRLNLSAVYSAGNVAVTGMLYGPLAAIIANLARFLHRKAQFTGNGTPRLNIIPQFSGQGFRLQADLDFSIRLGAVFYLAIKLYFLTRKRRKGSE